MKLKLMWNLQVNTVDLDTKTVLWKLEADATASVAQQLEGQDAEAAGLIRAHLGTKMTANLDRAIRGADGKVDSTAVAKRLMALGWGRRGPELEVEFYGVKYNPKAYEKTDKVTKEKKAMAEFTLTGVAAIRVNGDPAKEVVLEYDLDAMMNMAIKAAENKAAAKVKAAATTPGVSLGAQ